MATASQAIERIAEVAGILPATVFRSARTLREAGGDLWPQGSQGRGKAAHVQPHHLVNVVLSLAFDAPTTLANHTAAMLRGMIPHPDCSLNRAHGDLAEFFSEWNIALVGEELIPPELVLAVLPGATLGDGLERLIEKLADPSGSFLKDRLVRNGLYVDVLADGVPSAVVGYRSIDGENEYQLLGTYTLPQGNLTLGVPVSVAGITTIKRIHARMILCLAELWADTHRYRAGGAGTSGGNLAESTSSDEEPAKPSNTKTAAPQLPGRRTAVPSDQPADTELGSGSHPYPRSEREKSQSPILRIGRPSKHIWDDRDARSGHDTAYRLNA